MWGLAAPLMLYQSGKGGQVDQIIRTLIKIIHLIKSSTYGDLRAMVDCYDIVTIVIRQPVVKTLIVGFK